MATTARLCDIKGCKHPSRAICLCCQQYVCFDHLKEHHEIINAQLQPLADRINTLSEQLNNGNLKEASCFTTLNQWRENAHKTVDEFYQRKHQQLEQFIQENRGRQKDQVARVGTHVGELIRTQEATQQQIASITDSIRLLEQGMNKVQENPLIINSLVIDDNLAFIRNHPSSQDLVSSIRNDEHQSTYQERHLRGSDRVSSTSPKRNRWEIEEQTNRITEMMRVDILNIISTVIDSNNRTEMPRIAREIQNWLDETYGRSWTVEIYTAYNSRSNANIHNPIYFRVKDTRLGLTFVIFK